LLEAMIAGAIFFTAVVAVSLLAIQGSNNASKGMRYAQAARVATQEMERWAALGWTGLGGVVDGGSQPFAIPTYDITEEPDGGGRKYRVDVAIYDTSGLPGVTLDGGFPSPNLASSGPGIPAWVPSYWVQVQVVSFIPNSPTPVAVTESTYVSPN
jgi:hypothetical protein